MVECDECGNPVKPIVAERQRLRGMDEIRCLACTPPNDRSGDTGVELKEED